LERGETRLPHRRLPVIYSKKMTKVEGPDTGERGGDRSPKRERRENLEAPTYTPPQNEKVKDPQSSLIPRGGTPTESTNGHAKKKGGGVREFLASTTHM